MPKESSRNTNIHGNVEKLTQIGEVKGDVIIQQGQDAEKLLKNGVQLVKVGAHEQAIGILTEVIKASPLVSDAYYYLALALLKGKRPKVSTLAQIQNVEKHLQTACQLNDNLAHYYYLWALVKYDFYVVNGFMVRPPKIEELILAGRQSSHESSLIVEMIEQANGADNRIISAILGG